MKKEEESWRIAKGGEGGGRNDLRFLSKKENFEWGG